MKQTTLRAAAAALALGAATVGTPALAETALAESAVAGEAAVALAADDAATEETEASGPLDVEFTIEAVNDYRFRGISLSDKDFAIQPGITVSHESGLYASVWGSNVAPNGGDDIEVDLIAGFSAEAGPLTFDINATYYVYPGAGSLNYLEFITRTSTAVGKGEVGLTLAYAPSQANIGSTDNFYVAIDGSYPIGDSPFTIEGSFGFEDGAFGTNKKDWSLGVAASFGPLNLGVAYVDTANAGGFGNLADAGVVVKAGFTF
jgi:uncharacterized protein (TIGR02001 family)